MGLFCERSILKSGLVLILLSFAFHFSGQAQNGVLPCLNKRFSIVAHLVEDEMGNTNIADSTILGAIDSLNKHFEPICVSFEVCEFRTIENFQYDKLFIPDESDQLTIKNSVESRINIYFITEIIGSNDCGRATLGGIGTSGDIFILKRCTAPEDFTVSHEMGHFFGLKHTFEDPSSQLVDGTNCETTGDEICDTPADPYIDGITIDAYINRSDCRFVSTDKDANGDFYSPHVGNIMSYYPCACEFTDGQYLRMVETYLASNPKNW